MWPIKECWTPQIPHIVFFSASRPACGIMRHVRMAKYINFNVLKSLPYLGDTEFQPQCYRVLPTQSLKDMFTVSPCKPRFQRWTAERMIQYLFLFIDVPFPLWIVTSTLNTMYLTIVIPIYIYIYTVYIYLVMYTYMIMQSSNYLVAYIYIYIYRYVYCYMSLLYTYTWVIPSPL